jgi:hypothetical protein
LCLCAAKGPPPRAGRYSETCDARESRFVLIDRLNSTANP